METNPTDKLQKQLDKLYRILSLLADDNVRQIVSSIVEIEIELEKRSNI